MPLVDATAPSSVPGLAMLLALGAGLPLGGCGGASIAVSLTLYDAQSMTMSDLHQGDAVDLVRPPQGGYVVFIGTRVMGLESGLVSLDATIGDGGGAGEDHRTVMLVTAGDGSFMPDLRGIAGVANVAMCPSTASSDRYGHPFTLDLTVTELETRRMGEGKLTVQPVCRQADATKLSDCQCVCQAGFVLGKCPNLPPGD
jgi:hypothetical protein